ncbi:MAG: glycerol-3-phosphate 1-O-acyltransferase PlsY [Spirochaetia bacterium]
MPSAYTAVLHLAAIILFGYLLGSVPTSIVLGRIFFKTDIREHGSGNAGGTNAVRVFGWRAGALVILIDVAKGALAVLLVSRLPRFPGMETSLLSADATALAAGLAAVAGHIWTIFASFRGGKGVATAAGMVAGLYPVAFVATIPIFVIAVAVTGIVSVGSISVAIGFPLVLLILERTGVSHASPLLMGVSVAIGVLILFTHRSNIGRLRRGEEKRMFRKR